MILTKELIESILESRDSLIVTADGIDYTITEASEIPFNVEAIKEAYEFHELFERVQIKRKYGQYEAHKVNRGAPIRNKIVEFVGKKFITDEEMKDYLLRLEEEKGSSINKTQWFSRNGKYFESFENRGQKVWTLSKFGKRVLEYIIKSENEDTKKINENMSRIGLFKFVNESIITEKKEMYKISINTEVEDSKIANKFYNVRKGEKVELIDDDGDIATVKLHSGETVNIESKYVVESNNDKPYYATSQEGSRVEFYAIHGIESGNSVSYSYKNEKGKNVSGDAKIEKLRGNQGMGFSTPSGWVIIPKKFIGESVNESTTLHVSADDNFKVKYKGKVWDVEYDNHEDGDPIDLSSGKDTIIAMVKRVSSNGDLTIEINENMSKIGLFKLVNESSITESVYLDKHGELSSYDKENFTEIGRHTITLGKDLAAIILFGYSTRNWKGKNEFVAEVTCTSYSIDVRDLGNSYGSIISSETFGTEEDAKFKATNLFKSFKVK